LINSVPDAILLIRGERIAHCNEPATTLFGMPYQDLLDHDPADLSPACQPDGLASAAEFRQRIRTTLAQGRQWFEWQFQRAGKAPVATEVILDTVVLEGKPQVLAIIRDLTERKQAEQRIRFQASLLDQVRNAVLATDSDDRIIYWNRHASQLY